MGKHRICELCSKEAVAYCASDSAFLCMSCDDKVHGANFLVGRHVREIICSNCEEFTGDQISGTGLPVHVPICHSCLDSGELDSGDLDSLSSSACVSSLQTSSFCDITSNKKPGAGAKSRNRNMVNGGQRVNLGIDSKMVGILVNWCKRLGVNDYNASDIIRTSCNVFAICGEKLTILPFRICLVASLWLGLRFSGIKSLSILEGLTRLEQITGVPAKLISAAESKIERIYRSAKQHQNNVQSQNHSQDDQLLKEGWAESS
ncbi:hypothetical protein LIER_28813 [Lithospermum erythrorhizon]|uniref:B box-type domain-containing protein n=1 Tax=Lithospermum erythrorhizon TaxID=34254 RepID=A0AAV3RIL4_LITER